MLELSLAYHVDEFSLESPLKLPEEYVPVTVMDLRSFPRFFTPAVTFAS